MHKMIKSITGLLVIDPVDEEANTGVTILAFKKINKAMHAFF